MLILELLDYKANTVGRCTLMLEKLYPCHLFRPSVWPSVCEAHWPTPLDIGQDSSFLMGQQASEEVVFIWDRRGNQPAIGAQHWMESSTGKENYKHSPCFQRAQRLMEKANMATQENQALGLHCALNHVCYLEDAHKPWSLNIGNWSLWFGVK